MQLSSSPVSTLLIHTLVKCFHIFWINRVQESYVFGDAVLPGQPHVGTGSHISGEEWKQRCVSLTASPIRHPFGRAHWAVMDADYCYYYYYYYYYCYCCYYY